jgi:hypothetical protein
MLPQAAGNVVFSCQAPRPLALFDAEVPPAKPALLTRADASCWPRHVGQLVTQVYCPAFIQVANRFPLGRVTITYVPSCPTLIVHYCCNKSLASRACVTHTLGVAYLSWRKASVCTLATGACTTVADGSWHCNQVALSEWDYKAVGYLSRGQPKLKPQPA